jgi:hypothetical protein
MPWIKARDSWLGVKVALAYGGAYVAIGLAYPLATGQTLAEAAYIRWGNKSYQPDQAVPGFGARYVQPGAGYSDEAGGSSA